MISGDRGVVKLGWFSTCSLATNLARKDLQSDRIIESVLSPVDSPPTLQPEKCNISLLHEVFYTCYVSMMLFLSCLASSISHFSIPIAKMNNSFGCTHR